MSKHVLLQKQLFVFLNNYMKFFFHTFFFFFLLCVVGVVSFAYAQELLPTVNTNLPLGGTGEPGTGVGGLVFNVYRFAMLIAGLLAFGAIVYGAILRTTAGGNTTQVGEANKWIQQALIGLVLLLGATYLLGVINPDLTTLRQNPPIDRINTLEETLGLENFVPERFKTYGCQSNAGTLQCSQKSNCSNISCKAGTQCREIKDPLKECTKKTPSPSKPADSAERPIDKR